MQIENSLYRNLLTNDLLWQVCFKRWLMASVMDPEEARRFLTASHIISEVFESSACNLNLTPGSIICMGLAQKKNGFEKRDSNGLHLWAVEGAKREADSNVELF